MTSREQFEAECLNGLINGGLAKHENGKYASELTDAVWRGWQASREAVEIEIPENKLLSSSILKPDVIYGLKRKEVIECVRAAGIKVKGE